MVAWVRESDSVTLLGAILGAIESLTCGTHMSVVPHARWPRGFRRFGEKGKRREKRSRAVEGKTERGRK
jgi:hypothetical protein